MLTSNQQRAAGLQHTAPCRFTGGNASLSGENAYHQKSNRRIVAPWSHRHQYLLPTEITEPSLCSPQTSRGLLVYISATARARPGGALTDRLHAFPR
jgi:hypothetical protein